MIHRLEKKEFSLKQMFATVKKDKKKIEETIASLDEYKREALMKTWRHVNKYFLFIMLQRKSKSFP
jgi:structural maintenance of chromosome 2